MSVDTAYGKNWITMNKYKEYEWIIHIQGEAPENIDIGIYGQYIKNIKSFSSEFDKTKYGYALTFNGKKKHYSIKNRDTKYCNGGGFSCLDFIHIKLNYVSKTLKFYRNGTDLGIAFDVDNGLFMPNFDENNKDNLFGYRLAVKLAKSNCKVSIRASHSTKRETLLIDDNVEMLQKSLKKEAQNNNILNSPKNNQMRHEIIDDEKNITNYVKDWSPNNIFDKLDKLHIDIKNGSIKINEMINIYSLKEKENKSKKNKFTHEILQLKELFRAQQFIPGIMDTTFKFANSLVAWNGKVTPFIENHFRKWKYWSADEFTDWIIGFDNGRFNKYNNNHQLRNIMKKDDNCEMLKEMAKNVHVQKLVGALLRDTFKIDNSDDRKVLIIALNKLVTGQFLVKSKKQKKVERNVTRTFLSSGKSKDKNATPTKNKQKKMMIQKDENGDDMYEPDPSIWDQDNTQRRSSIDNSFE